jgi:hypothetical protein
LIPTKGWRGFILTYTQTLEKIQNCILNSLKNDCILTHFTVDNYMKVDKVQARAIENRIFTAPRHTVWPIPQREIDVNPALVQHTEWL